MNKPFVLHIHSNIDKQFIKDFQYILVNIFSDRVHLYLIQAAGCMLERAGISRCCVKVLMLCPSMKTEMHFN